MGMSEERQLAYLAEIETEFEAGNVQIWEDLMDTPRLLSRMEEHVFGWPYSKEELLAMFEGGNWATSLSIVGGVPHYDFKVLRIHERDGHTVATIRLTHSFLPPSFVDFFLEERYLGDEVDLVLVDVYGYASGQWVSEGFAATITNKGLGIRTEEILQEVLRNFWVGECAAGNEGRMTFSEGSVFRKSLDLGELLCYGISQDTAQFYARKEAYFESYPEDSVYPFYLLSASYTSLFDLEAPEAMRSCEQILGREDAGLKILAGISHLPVPEYSHPAKELWYEGLAMEPDFFYGWQVLAESFIFERKEDSMAEHLDDFVRVGLLPSEVDTTWFPMGLWSDFAGTEMYANWVTRVEEAREIAE